MQYLQDLEAYAASYKGLAKLYRLMYVADHCPPLKIDALRMALTSVMTTYNTNMYQQIHRKLQDAITRFVAYDQYLSSRVSTCLLPVHVYIKHTNIFGLS